MECLERCQDQAFQSCECEQCQECGLMPDECSGTECARTCQCSTCEHCQNKDSIEALRSVLAAPMPPIGGEPEVLACASFAKNGNIQCWSLQRDHASLKKLEGEGNRIVELVDSKHVTALSARLATSEKWAREHCNRAEELAGQIIELTDKVEARDQRIAALESRGLQFVSANVLPQCRDYSDDDDDWFRGQGKGFNECLDEVTPFVTRLQAEVARLKAGVGSDMTEIDRIQGEYDKQWRKARDLQYELTKARGLLRHMATDYARALRSAHERITKLGDDCDSVQKMLADNPNYVKSVAFLDHQPAPVAQGDDQ
jgi:hypothetical protein